MIAGDGSELELNVEWLLAAHAAHAAATASPPATGDEASFEIANAWYGAGETWADVTPACRANAALDPEKGVLSVEAANRLFGDPVVGVVKRLVVVCVSGDREIIASAREGSMLSIPARGAAEPD